MISQILQHLDALQIELSGIDPTRDFEAADKVADIASALRLVLDETSRSGKPKLAAQNIEGRSAA